MDWECKVSRHCQADNKQGVPVPMGCGTNAVCSQKGTSFGCHCNYEHYGNALDHCHGKQNVSTTTTKYQRKKCLKQSICDMIMGNARGGYSDLVWAGVCG